MMTKTISLKNWILLGLPVMQYIPQMFYGSKDRLNLSLFVERSTRIDFFFMHYANAIDFLILGYCIYRPEGILKKVKELIFVIVLLDFIHLLFFAKQGFQMSKIGVAFLIVYYSELINLFRDLIRVVMALKLITWLKIVGGGLWGLNLVEVASEIKRGTLFDSVDGWIKTSTAILGFVVLVYILRNKILDMKIKREELKKLKKENSASKQ